MNHARMTAVIIAATASLVIARRARSVPRERPPVPYDKALVSGVIHFDALNNDTKRAWLRAAAAVAKGL